MPQICKCLFFNLNPKTINKSVHILYYFILFCVLRFSERVSYRAKEKKEFSQGNVTKNLN